MHIFKPSSKELTVTLQTLEVNFVPRGSDGCRQIVAGNWGITNLSGTFPNFSFINAGDVNGILSVLELSGNNLTGSVNDWNGSNLRSLEEL